MAQNLLVVHQGALGDFVLTFPALIRLKAVYDQIDVLCQSQLGKLAQTLGLVKNYYPLEAAWVATLYSDPIDSKIKNLLAAYSGIVVFTLSDTLAQSIRHATAAAICRIPTKPPADNRIHLAQFFLEHLIRCGLLAKTEAGTDDLWLQRRKDKILSASKILLHPGSGSTRKRWPLSNFLEVAGRLEADGSSPEFVMGPAERELSQQFLQRADHNCKLHILGELTDLLDLYRSAGGYIGNDSGASHLAAFVGLPAVVIFGPADPIRWKPVGRAVEVVRPELDCRPCFETENENCADPACLGAITPESVLAAFYRVFTI